MNDPSALPPEGIQRENHPYATNPIPEVLPVREPGAPVPPRSPAARPRNESGSTWWLVGGVFTLLVFLVLGVGVLIVVGLIIAVRTPTDEQLRLEHARAVAEAQDARDALKESRQRADIADRDRREAEAALDQAREERRRADAARRDAEAARDTARQEAEKAKARARDDAEAAGTKARADAEAEKSRADFHVAENGQQMVVRLDRERLETTLVQVSRAGRVVVRVPAHGVRVRQPAEECRQLVVQGDFFRKRKNRCPRRIARLTSIEPVRK